MKRNCIGSESDRFFDISYQHLSVWGWTYGCTAGKVYYQSNIWRPWHSLDDAFIDKDTGESSRGALIDHAMNVF
jgi:hypothetical protein